MLLKFEGEAHFKLSCRCAFFCLFGTPTKNRLSSNSEGFLKRNPIKMACIEKCCQSLGIDGWEIIKQKKFLADEYVSILQRQVTELEAEIKERHRLVKSVAEWYKLCRHQNFSNRKIMAKLFVSRRYDLASPLGFAWLTQIYLPRQEISLCPRSRAWQIKEREACELATKKRLPV